MICEMLPIVPSDSPTSKTFLPKINVSFQVIHMKRVQIGFVLFTKNIEFPIHVFTVRRHTTAVKHHNRDGNHVGTNVP